MLLFSSVEVVFSVTAPVVECPVAASSTSWLT
jgi:hypothetical protein